MVSFLTSGYPLPLSRKPEINGSFLSCEADRLIRVIMDSDTLPEKLDSTFRGFLGCAKQDRASAFVAANILERLLEDAPRFKKSVVKKINEARQELYSPLQMPPATSQTLQIAPTVAFAAPSPRISLQGKEI